MLRTAPIVIALVVGAAIGVLGLRIVAADAQQAPGAGFHATGVSATQAGDAIYAWFVGAEGGAQFCKVTVQGPHCTSVSFDTKR